MSLLQVYNFFITKKICFTLVLLIELLDSGKITLQLTSIVIIKIGSVQSVLANKIVF